MSPPKLGILAGGGSLPARIIRACRDQGRAVFVLAFEDQTDPAILDGVDHAWVRLGAAGKGFKILHDQGVGELVMAGAIRRPSVIQLRPDWRAAKFFAKVGLKALGDDGLLSAVIGEIEAEGFHVVGVADVLPDALAPVGQLGAVALDDQAKADVARGIEVARGIGALDVGQGCVVQQGIVLALEAVEGTDAMIARCRDLRRDGPGGVLVKVKKPDQEQRADLPTVGVATVKAAAAAGLRGIAVQSGGAIIVDLEAMITEADRAGLFVIGVEVP